MAYGASIVKPKKKPVAKTVGKPMYGAGATRLAKTPLPSPKPALKPQVNPALIDPAYVAQQLSNRRNLAVSQAQGLYQQGQFGQDYGYNAQGARDYSNPYSRAALLEETFKRNQGSTLGSYANQGQLYSGALGVAQNENARNYSIGSDQLQRAASGAYGNLALGQAQAYANYGTQADSGALDAILRRLGVIK